MGRLSPSDPCTGCGLRVRGSGNGSYPLSRLDLSKNRFNHKVKPQKPAIPTFHVKHRAKRPHQSAHPFHHRTNQETETFATASKINTITAKRYSETGGEIFYGGGQGGAHPNPRAQTPSTGAPWRAIGTRATRGRTVRKLATIRTVGTSNIKGLQLAFSFLQPAIGELFAPRRIGNRVLLHRGRYLVTLCRTRSVSIQFRNIDALQCSGEFSNHFLRWNALTVQDHVEV